MEYIWFSCIANIDLENSFDFVFVFDFFLFSLFFLVLASSLLIGISLTSYDLASFTEPYYSTQNPTAIFQRIIKYQSHNSEQLYIL